MLLEFIHCTVELVEEIINTILLSIFVKLKHTQFISFHSQTSTCDV